MELNMNSIIICSSPAPSEVVSIKHMFAASTIKPD